MPRLRVASLANMLGLSAEQPLTIVPPPDLEAHAQVAERAVVAAPRRGARAAPRPRRGPSAGAGGAVEHQGAGVGGQADRVLVRGPGRQRAPHRAWIRAPAASACSCASRCSPGIAAPIRSCRRASSSRCRRPRRDRLATDVSLDVWRAYQDLQHPGAVAHHDRRAGGERPGVLQRRARPLQGRRGNHHRSAQRAERAARARSCSASRRATAGTSPRSTLARAIGVLDPALLAEHTPTAAQPQGAAR